MGLFNRKKDEGKKADAKAEKKAAAKPTAKKSEKKADTKPAAKKPVKKAASDTGNAHRVLLRPIVTEKSMQLSEMGQYVFEVAPKANKIEIKKAVKAVYDVEPTDVAVMRILGKPTRTRYGRGRRKHWRKAIVTLKKGQSIELFTTKA